MNNEIVWSFQSSRVELGVSRIVPAEFGERFTRYVTVAMRREVNAFGCKTVVTPKGKDKTAKEFGPTQKTDMGGSRFTVGAKEQWLLDRCGEWCRQLAATDQAMASLQKAGMLATEFVPIAGSAISTHLAFLAKQFLAQHNKPDSESVLAVEVIKP
jgi:hypothetical protein